MGHKMTNTDLIRDFIYGGKATFTIRSLSSGKHWTFTIKQKKGADCYFVALHAGDQDPIYIGYLKHNRLCLSAKSAPGITPRAVINHLLHYIDRGALHPKFEFFHEGTCGRCGRQLTDPVSIERGLGPTCATK